MKKKPLVEYMLFTLLLFGLLIKMEYATDSYAVFNFDKNGIFMQYAMLGRFITAIVGKIIKEIKASEYVIYLVSYILTIFFATLSQYKLYTLIRKNVENKILKLIIPTLIILNPFSIELFLYIEKGIMWFGVFLCICAVEKLVSFFETKKKSNIVYAMIYMFLANCSYQGIIGIFISIALVFILKYSTNKRVFVLNNSVAGIIYAIPAFLNYALIKMLYKESRINGQIVIKDSLKIILENIKNMYVNMYKLLPKYSFILLILFTFLLFWCKILKEKKYLHILDFFYILIGITFFSIIPQIVQSTKSIWIVPRSTYSFASMYGIILLYIAINYDIENTMSYFIILISMILLVFQAQSFITIERDRFLLNQKDAEITSNIINQIKNYETKTGNRIFFVSIYQDDKPNYTYDGIFAIGDMNIKCYSTDWSSVEILKYYLKRDLKKIEPDKAIENYFKKQNWDEFNINQILLIGNTINICNY